MAGLSLENLLGVKIKATTILDTVIQGKVYAYDVGTSSITIISEKPVEDKSTKDTYRILKTSFIKSVEVISKNKNNKNKNKPEKITFKTIEPKISPLNVEDLKAKEIELSKQQTKERLQAAREAFIEKNLKIIGGINGREIYKKVTKLFPLEEITVRNQAITLFGTVRINKPWGLENVEVIDKTTAEKDKRVQSSIEFVKSIVTDVNGKIAGG